jgi:predicted lipoprotein with Yx(FWY)xxD motif
MSRTLQSRIPAGRTRRMMVTGMLGLAAVLAAAGCGSASSRSAGSPGGSAQVVHAVANRTLNATVLVDRQGHTLYTLSAERQGRFICTRTSDVPGTSTPCVTLWRPLTVGQGGAVTSSVGQLGTIRRPDGAGLQVTYRGMPLYTFTQDRQPGDATGNGFKDVGTWRAVTVGSTSSGTGGAATTPASGPYGAGY